MADSTQISSLPGAGRTPNNVVLRTREIKGAERGPQGSQPHRAAPRGQLANKGAASLLPHGGAPGGMPAPVAQALGGGGGGGGGPRQLPSRHIPSMPQQYTQDQAARPNYVPPQKAAGDYIAHYDSHTQAQRKRTAEAHEQKKLDSIYDELQLPVLAMVLFFLFQMPYFRRKVGQVIPSFFLKDGNPSVSGYMSLTFLFGGAFYGITRLTKYLAE